MKCRLSSEQSDENMKRKSQVVSKLSSIAECVYDRPDTGAAKAGILLDEATADAQRRWAEAVTAKSRPPTP